MSSVLHHCFSLREAEENRKKEHDAAILIQSCFRACKVRAYLRYGVFLCPSYPNIQEEKNSFVEQMAKNIFKNKFTVLNKFFSSLN